MFEHVTFVNNKNNCHIPDAQTRNNVINYNNGQNSTSQRVNMYVLFRVRRKKGKPIKNE